MKSHADSSTESKSRSVATISNQAPSVNNGPVQFVDHRPQAVLQKKWQEMAETGYHERRFLHFGGITNVDTGSSIPQNESVCIQRDIIVNKVDNQPEEKHVPGWWAGEYCEVNKEAEWSRALQALKSLDGQTYNNRTELFDAVSSLVAKSKSRAVLPLENESDSFLIALEIDYYHKTLTEKNKPIFNLNRTYQSNWDDKGGFGCEYRLGNTAPCVIHVHRGKNGGLKSANAKTWDKRKEKEGGYQILKINNLIELGIKETDTTQKEEDK